MARKIEVVDYNPAWANQFKEEAKKIKKMLGKNCTAVYHIGSTSVKGMKARPIIDILTIVKNIQTVSDAELCARGYEDQGECGGSGRRIYVKGGDCCTHQIYMMEAGDRTEFSRYLAFRGYLDSNSDTAKEYAELKTRLAEQFPYDSESYYEGRDAFMRKLEEAALKWQKQQEHIETCMSLGMCLGMALGTAFGTLYSNLSIGMCMGISVGMCLGLAYGYATGEKDAK